jgi:UDP:flavonoid glycosyltransferase YjiC (YdhE family)
MKRTKITFLAVGSRGDLNPSCALAQELITRGYEVCIATHKNFQSFVNEKGIDYAPIAGNYEDILSTEAGLSLLEGKGKLRLIDDEVFYNQLIDAYKACQGSNAIIVFPLSLWGYHIAEKLQIPCICSSYVPITPTKDFPFLKFGISRKTQLLSSYLNYASYFLVEFLFWQADRKIINIFRKQVLNLSPIHFLGTRYRNDAPPKFNSEEIPFLYQFSSQVIPRPSDWKQPNIHIIHHGGSGTTALGLKAGVPQILTPFFADQPAWAEKLTNLGVSPISIPFKQLSSQKLIAAIQNTVDNSLMYDQAKKIGELMKQENGVNLAADKIRDILNTF